MGIVRESLRFERKKDAHSAMGIGRRSQIERWLEETGIDGWTINNDMTIDIKGHLYLMYTDLSGFPDFIQFGKIDGNFFINGNELVSLKGCPYIIGGSFDCSYNKLTNLEYFPISIEGNLYCYNNRIKFTQDEILAICDVKREISN